MTGLVDSIYFWVALAMTCAGILAIDIFIALWVVSRIKVMNPEEPEKVGDVRRIDLRV